MTRSVTPANLVTAVLAPNGRIELQVVTDTKISYFYLSAHASGFLASQIVEALTASILKNTQKRD